MKENRNAKINKYICRKKQKKDEDEERIRRIE
jgi:hypothetical protein